jgi:hypothetical protein
VLLFTGDPEPPPSASGPFPAYTTPALPTTKTVVTTANAVTPPSTPSTSTSTEKPCPQDAARYLPGGTGTALLVAQTAKSLITICRIPDGRIFYDGQARGQAASDDTHIVLPAQAEGGGFVAVNGDYRYRVDGGRLVVSAGSDVLSDDELTTVG